LVQVLQVGHDVGLNILITVLSILVRLRQRRDVRSAMLSELVSGSTDSLLDATLLHGDLHLVLVLVAPIDELVHLGDQTAKGVLLVAQLYMNPIEARHKVVKVLILDLNIVVLILVIEEHELVTQHADVLVVLLSLLVNLDQVSQLGPLLPLSDLNNNSHDHVLETVGSLGLCNCELFGLFYEVETLVVITGDLRDVVFKLVQDILLFQSIVLNVIKRVLLLLLQNLVLEDEQGA